MMSPPSIKFSQKRFWLPITILFFLLAIIVFGESNQSLFFTINNFSQYTGTVFWQHMTLAGDVLTLLMLIMIFIGRHAKLLWSLFTAALVCGVVVQSMKWGIQNPRPTALLDAGSYTLIGPALSSTYSLPSGHTASATVIFTVIALYMRAPLIWIAAVLLFIGAGMSRIVLGVHWPLDVLSGIGVGWISAFIGIRWSQIWFWGLRPSGMKIISLLLLTSAFYTLFFHNHHLPDVRWFQSGFSLLCIALSLKPIYGIWKKTS